ncbi:MAG: hypothetical protein OWS74_08430, partial [Firmicutes bacterium]|nr:hypothetical protein [Bacillota bacterium]
MRNLTSGSTELSHNTLGIFDNLVIGVASTAPAYSVATTMAALVMAVGLSAPALLIDNFFPMLGIAIAFYFLNRYYGPSAGGCYTWVSRVMDPYLGYLTGWATAWPAIMTFVIGIPLMLYYAAKQRTAFFQPITKLPVADAHHPV